MLNGDNNIFSIPPLKIINNLNNEIEYYEGCFENNLFNGKGLLISKNGDYYFGDWNKGKWKRNNNIKR